MYPYHRDIPRLKAEHDALSARKDALARVLVPFRTGLLETLEALAQTGLEVGLPDIEAPKRKADTTDFLEVTFCRNRFELILISDYDSVPDTANGKLVSKFLVYASASDDSTPLIEISICEVSNEAFQYNVHWYANEGKTLLAGGDSVTEADGSHVANFLFDFFYSWQHIWAEKPKLAAIRNRNHSANSLGFPTKPVRP